MGTKIQDAFEKAWKEASKSPCLTRKVGAVLLLPNVVYWGTNGSEDEPCTQCTRAYDENCPSICAEQRCIYNALEDTGATELSEGILVSTDLPCDTCISLIKETGIKEVYFSRFKFDVPRAIDWQRINWLNSYGVRVYKTINTLHASNQKRH